MTTKPIIYISLDVETGGQYLGLHPLLQIGMVAMTENETCLFKKDYYFQPPDYNSNENIESFYKSFDNDCLSNFWLKNNKELLEVIYKNAIPISEAISDFIKDFENLEEKYNLIIICDNPALDFGFINYYLGFYGKHRPLNIDENNNFRPIYDTRSYAMGAVRKEFNHIKLSAKNIGYWLEFELPTNKHTHIASDDALYTGKMFIRTYKHLISRTYTTETGIHWY